MKMMTNEQREKHLATLAEIVLTDNPSQDQRHRAAAATFLLIGQALLDLSRIADAFDRAYPTSERA